VCWVWVQILLARLFTHSPPSASSPEADEREEERDVVEAVDAPEHSDLGLVPRRVAEHELDEEAPLEHRLLVAEHVKRVLAVVLAEPAVPHATERDAVQAILEQNISVQEVWVIDRCALRTKCLSRSECALRTCTMASLNVMLPDDVSSMMRCFSFSFLVKA
jgi:hypothetical protein